jgi:uncharacterized protein YqgC (DUF456 family)
MLALLSFVTIAMVAFGVDLLDGMIETRRLGEASVGETPGKYAALVLGYLICWPFIILGWFGLVSEWRQDYLPPLKPPLDDPGKRRRM